MIRSDGCDSKLIGFLGKVLPDVGRYAAFHKNNGFPKNIFFDSIEQLAAWLGKMVDVPDVYFATAAYGCENSRTQANVVALKALRVDIDAGEAKFAKHPEGAYPDADTALRAVADAIRVGLPKPSLIVSSGQGYHLYWQLDQAHTPDKWVPVARTLQRLGEHLKLRIDPTCTVDTARVLRPVGSLHNCGNRVSVRKEYPNIYTLGELHQLMLDKLPEVDPFEAALAARPAPKSRHINDDILGKQEGPPASLVKVAERCAVVQWVRNTEGNVPEPVWRGVLGLAKYTEDGQELIHPWSGGHPAYSASETQEKFDRWNTPPTTCTYFNTHAPALCSKCKHKGQITTPKQLGTVDKPLEPAQIVQQGVEAAGAEWVLGNDRQLYMVLTHRGNAGRAVRNMLRADGEESRDAIRAEAYAATQKTPPDSAIDALVSRKRHELRQQGDQQPIHLRVAQVGRDIFVRRAPGHVTRISPAGVVDVDDIAPGVPLFAPGRSAGALPAPEPFDDCATALTWALQTFNELFGLPASSALLLLAWAAECLRTETPYPILEIVGPSGSGKSTLGDLMRALIDPVTDGGRMTAGLEAKDLMAAAGAGHLISVDNAGKLDRATENTLCVVSTGGTFLARKLYTDGDAVQHSIKRPLLLTAVWPSCVAPDLVTRVVRLEMPVRDGNHISEGEIKALVVGAVPRMVGAIYTLTAGALGCIDHVRGGHEWRHRMVDFDQMGAAILAAAGEPPERFIDAAAGMRHRMARRDMSGDVFLMAVLACLRKLALKPTCDKLPSLRAVTLANPAYAVVAGEAGKCAVLIRPGVMRPMLVNPSPTPYREDPIPRTDRSMTDAMRRVAPVLASLGIEMRELECGTRTVLRFEFDDSAVVVE